MKTHFSFAIPCVLLTVAVAVPSHATPKPRFAVCAPAKKLDHMLDAELHDAVAAFNVGKVRKLLARGADPNTDLKATDGTMLPVLQWITSRVSFGEKFDATKLQIVNAYVEAGADVERPTATGETPLLFAAHTGSVPILNCLLKAGANIEAKNPDGVTALMAAANAGQSGAVRALIAAGANVNARDKANGTALLAAASFLPATIKVFNTPEVEKAAHLAIVKMLVAAGADVSARATDGTDAISTADKTGMPEVSAYLRGLQAPPVVAPPVVAPKPDNKILPAPNVLNTDGATPLMVLATQKPFDAVKAMALLEAGADVNALNKDIESALMFAADAASPDAVRFLLKNGAKAAFVALDGSTAITLAVAADKGDGSLDVVNQLLAAGADANAQNHDGKSALDLARAQNNPRVVDALSKAAAATKPAEPPMTTAQALELGPNGETNLMFAATDTPFDSAKAAALIKAGVKVNAKSNNGATALMLSCMMGTPDAVRFLLANGAKPNLADENGYTAIMFATQMEGVAALDVVNQLIAVGAKVNAKAPDGSNALGLARQKNNADVVAALVKAGAK